MIGARTHAASEPVIGYRSWRLEDYLLHSPYLPDKPWREATQHARCERSFTYAGLPHLRGAPAEKCKCGLYAQHLPPPRIGASYPADRPISTHFHRNCYVAGAVVAWGRIQVHQTGIRAQHMRILALQAPSAECKLVEPDAWTELRFAARRYAVPILDTDDMVAYAEEFGAVVPVGERP